MPGKRKAVSPGVASTKKPKHSGKGWKPPEQAGDETLALLRILCSNKENKNSKGNKSPVPKAPVPAGCSQRVNWSLPPGNEAPQQHPGIGHASHHGQPISPALNHGTRVLPFCCTTYVNIQPNPQFAVDLINALQYQPVRDLFGGLVEQYSSKAVKDMQCKISTMDSEITSLCK